MYRPKTHNHRHFLTLSTPDTPMENHCTVLSEGMFVLVRGVRGCVFSVSGILAVSGSVLGPAFRTPNRENPIETYLYVHHFAPSEDFLNMGALQ